MAQEKDAGRPSERESGFSTPTISLPKGGGAIRGIGEKFAANPVTGTGSMTVPIATRVRGQQVAWLPRLVQAYMYQFAAGPGDAAAGLTPPSDAPPTPRPGRRRGLA